MNINSERKKGVLSQKLLLLFGHLVISNYLRPHVLQHPSLPCPPLFPKTCSNSCPWNQWCCLTVSNGQRLRWLGGISEIDIFKLHEVQGWCIRGGIDVIWVRMLPCIEIQRTIGKQSKEWRKINKHSTWGNHMEKDFEFERIMAFFRKWKVRKAWVREEAWSQPERSTKDKPCGPCGLCSENKEMLKVSGMEVKC